MFGARGGRPTRAVAPKRTRGIKRSREKEMLRRSPECGRSLFPFKIEKAASPPILILIFLRRVSRCERCARPSPDIQRFTANTPAVDRDLAARQALLVGAVPGLPPDDAFRLNVAQGRSFEPGTGDVGQP